MSLLQQLRECYDALRRSERKVADILLADPGAVSSLTMVTLADAAGVSQPTVSRLAKSVGCSGFADLKLRLVQEVATGVPYVGSNLSAEDDIPALTRKIFDGAAAGLFEVRDSLDRAAVERAVAALAAAPRIEFFGQGTSFAVAQDAYHKFFRLDIRAGLHADSIMQQVAAATLAVGDVALFISYSGRTRQMVDLAAAVRARGALVIGITAKAAPLGQLSDVVLDPHISEDTDVYLPTSSRLAQLAIVDLLAAGVFLRCRSTQSARLKAVKRAVARTRLDGEGGPEND